MDDRVRGDAEHIRWQGTGTGAWFGDLDQWSAFVPEGWDAAIQPIVAKQRELDRAHEASIARLNATKPISGPPQKVGV